MLLPHFASLQKIMHNYAEMQNNYTVYKNTRIRESVEAKILKSREIS